MRGSLIATGGALLAAAMVFGSAGTAAADIWNDWTHHYPAHCDLGVNDDSTYHHITDHGVFSGTRDADACKGHNGWAHNGKWDWDHKRHGHHNFHKWKPTHWPTSGTGNWIGDT
ncbi:hypothetical protein ITP53_51210 [Nonomuraea sp. K274]|uniref:Lactococcin 972 family bacteriocin n=1 Tax=Nonomuraea cypriaca TaxID=1187855 RepID=A0A931F5Q1_9ACTN|nr:hypothetical protein [Nonomuraea cypriaca]MBF8193912.1 hypothetical protein [Nonomuraea cypriaca]